MAKRAKSSKKAARKSPAKRAKSPVRRIMAEPDAGTWEEVKAKLGLDEGEERSLAPLRAEDLAPPPDMTKLQKEAEARGEAAPDPNRTARIAAVQARLREENKQRQLRRSKLRRGR